MAENPDRQLSAMGKMAPSAGDLRFVLREVDSRELRILQRFEWSFTEKQFDWYDIHLAQEGE